MPGPMIDLKINFGGQVGARRQGSSEWDAQCGGGWAMGVWDAPHAVRWPDDLDFVGVTLRPGGAMALFGVQAHELRNDVVGIDLLFGALALELRDRLAQAPNAQARFALLEQLLAPRLRPVPELDRIAPALRLMRRRGGVVSIADLAARAEVSHKHLIALFDRVVGATPKTLARLYRLEHLLARIDTEEPVSWTRTAHDACYCDQSHFNRDFRRLTGHTPGRYLELRRSAEAAHPRYAAHRRLLPEG